MKRLALVLGTAAVLGAVPAGALANPAVSSNWSGYAAHRSGVRFRAVSAEWREPAAQCKRDRPKYSSTWVGLGGYVAKSIGAEQIGVELDCTGAGRQFLRAWYELLPAAAKPIAMTIRSGDEVAAGVSVTGRRVSLRLTDGSRGESFARSFTPRVIDQTSADWVVEAPTGCLGPGACQILPLADFGSVRITDARAATAGGWGSISSSRWTATRIVLVPSVFSFDADGVAGAAAPTALRDAGATFDVRYKRLTIGSLASRRSLRAVRSVQPGSPARLNGG